jgi:hypothetical protein
MLISAATCPDALAERGLEWWHGARISIGWKGLLYWPGETAGAASAERLEKELEKAPLAEVAGALHGVFGLFVYERQTSSWSIMVDNAGLYRVFSDGEDVATSFLELLDHRRAKGNSIDLESLLDYIAHCAVFEERTTVQGVTKIQAGEILELRPGGQRSIVRKSLPPSDADHPEHVIDYYADLAAALSPSRLSVDMTGGFDSRVVACMLHQKGAVFDGSMAGFAESADSLAAREVAKVLGCDFHFAHHDIDRLEGELPQVFRDSDAATDLAGFHRDRQNNLGRLARGVQAIAHGGAGELFRDHNYVQDFPLYGVKTSRLERLYDLRICPVPLPAEYFTKDAQMVGRTIRPRALAILEKYRQSTNNQTYDTIYFKLRSPEAYGPFYSSYINFGLNVAAPMLDYRNANIAIHLDPWRRCLQGWHREIVTRHCPKLAALRTAEGFTASSRPVDRVLDGLVFGKALLARTGRKLTERHLGKALFHRVGALAAEPPDYRQRLRASPQMALAIERLQQAHVLAPGLDPATIRSTHVPRVISMGLLLDFLRNS